jgi:hypothetical protein
VAALPEPWKSLRAKIEQIAERVKKLENTSPFSGTGMSVPSDGTTQVDGTLNVTGNETVGGTLNVTGNTIIGGTLSLPAGIINNDALANPVVPGQAFQGASTFALSVAGSNIITVNKTVPTGFTSVVVNAYGRVAATNSTATKDAVYSAVDVNGTGGNQFGNEVAAGDFGSVSAGYSTLLTGLTAGATVATHLFASTGLGGWASDPSNGADLSVTYLWFR